MVSLSLGGRYSRSCDAGCRASCSCSRGAGLGLLGGAGLGDGLFRLGLGCLGGNCLFLLLGFCKCLCLLLCLCLGPLLGLGPDLWAVLAGAHSLRVNILRLDSNDIIIIALLSIGAVAIVRSKVATSTARDWDIGFRPNL